MKWVCKAMTSDTYLAPDGGWVSDQSQARIFTDEERDDMNNTKYKILEPYWDNIWMPVE
jgi:hypothetical protein